MKRSLPFWFTIALVLSLLFAGCAAKTAGSEAAQERGSVSGRAPAVMATAPAPSLDRGYGEDAAAEAERKVILNASLQLVVKDTEATVDGIKTLVAGEDGYVGSASVWREGTLLHAQLTVHVPADKMETFIGEVKKLAVRVEREESSGQDVTEEYVDLEARLRNLEAAETELRTLLTEVRKSSGQAEDIVAIYRELVEIRGQIEQVKGRMQYIDRSVALATVVLNLSERQPEPIGQPGWQPLQTVRRALNALVEIVKFLVEATIWVVLVVVPILAVPALVIWLLVRLLRRRRRPSAS